jgi:hypothetical protein
MSQTRKRLLLINICVALLIVIQACSGPPGPASTARSAGTSTSSSVLVSTDRSRYRQGDPIRVSVTNRLETAIFAPRGDACAVVSLWRQSGADWVSADACPPNEVNVTEIRAGGTMTALLGPVPRPPNASGPIVIGPIAPAASSRPVRSLPTAQPQPSRVVPEGAIAAPFSATISPIVPGTYRLAITFAAGTRDAPAATAYSEPFVVEPSG